MIGALLTPRASRTPEIGATHSGNWAPFPGWGLQSKAGPLVSEQSALTLPAMFCAVDLVASHMAMLPFPVLQRIDDDTRIRRREHPVDQLLNLEASPRLTAFTYRKTTHIHKMLWGNGYTEILRPRIMSSEVSDLRLIHPDSVLVEGSDNPKDDLVYQVTRNDGRTDRVRGRNMLHVPALTMDGIEGLGLIRQLARENVGLGLAIATYAARFFGNNMQMGVMFSSDVAMKKEDRDSQIESLKRQHAGPENAFNALFLNGVKASRMAQDNDAAEVMEQMTFSVQDVSRWIGVPPPLLMDLSNGTFNNTTELGRWYIKFYLTREFKPYEQEYSRKLFTEREIRDGFYLQLNVEGLLRGDPKERGSFYKIMAEVAGMSANEVRAKEDMNGIGPEGDAHFRPLNVGELGAEEEPEEPEDEPDNMDEDDEPEDAASALRIRIAAAHQVVFDDVQRRMVAIEDKAYHRAEKAGRLDGWPDKFYPEHAIRVRGALTPCIEALAGVIRATLPGTVLDDEWDQFVGEFTKLQTERYIAGARVDFGQVDHIAKWFLDQVLETFT